MDVNRHIEEAEYLEEQECFLSAMFEYGRIAGASKILASKYFDKNDIEKWDNWATKETEARAGFYRCAKKLLEVDDG